MSLPANDLLSPLYDGELTSAERLIVEQQLATNFETRRELSEIRQVSAFLKGLPCEALPPEFPQHVLQGIEREMLIPADCPHPENVWPASVSWKRNWSVGAGAVLTSAVALLLLVRAVDHDRAPRGGMQVPTPAQSEPEKLATFGGAAPTADSAVQERLSPAADVADRPEANTVAGAAGLNSVAALGLNRGAANSANFYLDQSALRTAEIGDVVEALQTDGSDVAVVRLTVVDRQEGLEALQVLLTNNRIARVTTAEAEGRGAAPAGEGQSKKMDLSRRDGDKNASREVPEQMLAVFVESDSEHLADALRELRKTEFIQSLEVESPISLAQLDDAENKTAERSEKAKRATSSVRRSLSESVEKQLDRKSGDNSPRLAAKSTAPAEEAKDVRSFARQQAMQLPADALSLSQTQNESRTRANVAQRGQNQSRAKGQQLVEQRPMQVLFVVVGQAAASKPAPSTDATKQSAPTKANAKPSPPQEEDGAA